MNFVPLEVGLFPPPIKNRTFAAVETAEAEVTHHLIQYPDIFYVSGSFDMMTPQYKDLCSVVDYFV